MIILIEEDLRCSLYSVYGESCKEKADKKNLEQDKIKEDRDLMILNLILI